MISGSSSVRQSTRSAPLVPTISAARSSVPQPLPRLEHAPSPQAGNQGTSRSPGQRSAHSAVRPLRGASSIGGSRSSIPRASSSSHVLVRWSSSPVPEAIETLAAASPSSRRWTYSPGEIQTRTRSNASGSRSRSHASLAGQ